MQHGLGHRSTVDGRGSVQIHRGSLTPSHISDISESQDELLADAVLALRSSEGPNSLLRVWTRDKRFQLHRPTHNSPNPCGYSETPPWTPASPHTLAPPSGVSLHIPRQMASVSTCAAYHLRATSQFGQERHGVPVPCQVHLSNAQLAMSFTTGAKQACWRLSNCASTARCFRLQQQLLAVTRERACQRFASRLSTPSRR